MKVSTAISMFRKLNTTSKEEKQALEVLLRKFNTIFDNPYTPKNDAERKALSILEDLGLVVKTEENTYIAYKDYVKKDSLYSKATRELFQKRSSINRLESEYVFNISVTDMTVDTVRVNIRASNRKLGSDNLRYPDVITFELTKMTEPYMHLKDFAIATIREFLIAYIDNVDLLSIHPFVYLIHKIQRHNSLSVNNAKTIVYLNNYCVINNDYLSSTNMNLECSIVSNKKIADELVFNSLEFDTKKLPSIDVDLNMSLLSAISNSTALETVFTDEHNNHILVTPGIIFIDDYQIRVNESEIQVSTVDVPNMSIFTVTDIGERKDQLILPFNLLKYNLIAKNGSKLLQRNDYLGLMLKGGK